MFLTKIKPNWMLLHHLKKRPFIHFNLQTLGSQHDIPYDFMKSFNDLPSDTYIPNNDPVTRSRRYANIKIDVSNNYEYLLRYTNNDIFQQKVDDNCSVKRKFELINYYHITQPWLLNLICQISALSVLNHDYYKGHKKIKEVDIHIHQVRQTAYAGIPAHNSPEGIHRDGCDYIMSALVINRNNICGGESKIYNHNKVIQYKTILENQEGIYQEDIEQWHYVTPIQTINSGLGFRDILGIDLILNT